MGGHRHRAGRELSFHRVHVLVTPARQIGEDHGIASELRRQRPQVRDRVRRLESGQDALVPRELLECLERLRIRRVRVFGAAL